MAPIMSARIASRALEATELDPRSSPFHAAPRQSLPSSHTSVTSRSTVVRLLPRLNDNAEIVSQTYGSPNGPDAGTVVGIVLGSVGGFLLILWLIYTITNLGNTSNVIETGSVGDGSAATRRSRRHRHKSSRSRSARPRETVEVRRTERIVPVPMPMPMPMQTERIVVEERSRSRAPPPPMPPPPPRMVPEDSDDEVVVIEENTPSRRKDSRHHKRRSSRRSSERRRSSGFREVDPYRYAGGDASVRSVSRRRSPSRGR